MDFNTFRERASLITLPIETRFMVYDLIISCTGTVVIFAQYELTKNVDAQTVNLLHVNRLIRAEVHEYFYKNQNFQFRSFPAMEKFLDKIGPYYAGIIKNVVIGSWLAQRAQFAEQVTPFLRKLSAIDRLTVQAPAHGFVTEWSEEAELGRKAIAVLDASERLAAGKFYLAWVYTYGNGVMQFVAQDVPHPSKDDPSFQDLLKAIDGYRWYRWQSGYVVNLVEVKGSDCLLESRVTQRAESEVKMMTNQHSSQNHPFYNGPLPLDEDDPGL